MPSRSTSTIYIAPDCPPEVEAHVRATSRGEQILGRSLMSETKRKPHIPGPRVELPGQLELPQTEARPTEMAKRLALAPITPDKPQVPCDVGLFSDTKDQTDLF